MPLPGSGMETIATDLSGETVTSVGPEAVALSSSMPFVHLGRWSRRRPATTTSAGSGPPGNAAWMRS